MLDLGAQYCTSSPRCGDCPVARSCRWQRDGGPDPAPRSAGVSRPQPAFHGSNRQARGRVLAALRERPRSDGRTADVCRTGRGSRRHPDCRTGGRRSRRTAGTTRPAQRRSTNHRSLRRDGVLGNLDLVSSIDVPHFKEVLGHFVTGVAVVTAATPEGPVGLHLSNLRRALARADVDLVLGAVVEPLVAPGARRRYRGHQHPLL